MSSSMLLWSACTAVCRKVALPSLHANQKQGLMAGLTMSHAALEVPAVVQDFQHAAAQARQVLVHKGWRSCAPQLLQQVRHDV